MGGTDARKAYSRSGGSQNEGVSTGKIHCTLLQILSWPTLHVIKLAASGQGHQHAVNSLLFLSIALGLRDNAQPQLAQGLAHSIIGNCFDRLIDLGLFASCRLETSIVPLD
jgi:hypothetical protein